MAFNVSLGLPARHAVCVAVAAMVDSGSGSGRLRIYDDGEGAGIPAMPESTPNGQILCEIILAKPAFGAPVAGGMSLEPVAIAPIGIGGRAHYFRIATSVGTVLMQGTTGESADVSDLTLDEKDLLLGGDVQLTSAQFAVLE